MKKNIILGVTGSISAYKAADLTSVLTQQGYNVNVIMTKAALQFITPVTMQALSHNKVVTDVFDEYNPTEVTHIALAEKADLFLIAPASADILAKLAHGIADDMLTSCFLANRSPVLIAPAMNTHMYENPVTQNNMKFLKSLNYHFIDPVKGMLACGYEGIGKLTSTRSIVERIEEIITGRKKICKEQFMVMMKGDNSLILDVLKDKNLFEQLNEEIKEKNSSNFERIITEKLSNMDCDELTTLALKHGYNFTVEMF